MKVCTNPKCKHKGEPQFMSNFSKRGSKKNGDLQYHSWCKSCGAATQKKRQKANLKIIRGHSLLDDVMVYKDEEKATSGRGKAKPIKPINPMFLVRGNISTDNISCSFSQEV